MVWAGIFFTLIFITAALNVRFIGESFFASAGKVRKIESGFFFTNIGAGGVIWASVRNTTDLGRAALTTLITPVIARVLVTLNQRKIMLAQIYGRSSN